MILPWSARGPITTGHPRWRRLACRLLALAGGAAQPRLSGAGVALIVTLISVMVGATLAALFVGEIHAMLDRKARGDVERLENVLHRALLELNATSPLMTGTCDEAARRALGNASLDGRALDRVHWLAPDAWGTCSPAHGDHGRVSAPLLEARQATRNLVQDLLLAIGGIDRQSLLIARPLADRSMIVGEIYMERLADDLLQPSDMAGRARLTRWDGAVLLDTAMRPAASLGALAIEKTSGDDLVHPFGLSRSHQSETFPFAVEWQAVPAVPFARASLWFGMFVAIAGTLSLLSIRQSNRLLERRASTEWRLREALRERQFVSVIQPIVDASTGACKGGEVLMRWRHPVRGLLTPNEFMLAAERTGLIAEMTTQIMIEACNLLSDVHRRHPELYFTFNIGAAQLRAPGFIDSLDQVFNQQTLPPNCVVIELVEREAVDAGARVVLAQLRQQGYRVAIDDFGTGQSSLALLPSIGFDILKIDREFVCAIDANPLNLPVLNTVIDLARELDVQAVAEGVETVAQHEYLLARGVQGLQGFLFARPMEIADFNGWLLAPSHQRSDTDPKQYRRPVHRVVHQPSMSLRPLPGFLTDRLSSDLLATFVAI